LKKEEGEVGNKYPMSVDNSYTLGYRISRIFLSLSTTNGRTEICSAKEVKKYVAFCAKPEIH
jgi:hypothetical protein